MYSPHEFLTIGTFNATKNINFAFCSLFENFMSFKFNTSESGA